MPASLLIPEDACPELLAIGPLLSALESISRCVCKEPIETSVTDSGLVLRPGASDLSVTYKLPDGVRDISIYNGTKSVARVSLPTGHCYLPPNGTQVLTNPRIEPALKPFSGGVFAVVFDRAPGPNSFVVINFRIF